MYTFTGIVQQQRSFSPVVRDVYTDEQVFEAIQPFFPSGPSVCFVCFIVFVDSPDEDQYETLLAYRSTPLSNGYSPAELLMGRKLRTTVPVVPSSLDPQWSQFQDARKAQCENKQRQKKAFDKRHRVVDLRPLKPGEHVWVKDMNRRGTVKTHMPAPPRSYVVKTQHGDVRRNRRHLNPTPVAPTYDALRKIHFRWRRYLVRRGRSCHYPASKTSCTVTI